MPFPEDLTICISDHVACLQCAKHPAKNASLVSRFDARSEPTWGVTASTSRLASPVLRSAPKPMPLTSSRVVFESVPLLLQQLRLYHQRPNYPNRSSNALVWFNQNLILVIVVPATSRRICLSVFLPVCQSIADSRWNPPKVGIMRRAIAVCILYHSATFYDNIRLTFPRGFLSAPHSTWRLRTSRCFWWRWQFILSSSSPSLIHRKAFLPSRTPRFVSICFHCLLECGIWFNCGMKPQF